MVRPRPRIVISFELPSEIRNGFPSLLEKVQKHIVREAIRSALLPVRNALKAKVMSLPNISDQSSGATSRALSSKYGNSIRDPFRFYGIIGVDNKHIEAITPERSPVYASARHRQVAFGVKRRMKNGRLTLSKRNQRREVRSTIKRNISALQKRWPARYLHLWENGFTHRTSTISKTEVASGRADKGRKSFDTRKSFPGRHYFQIVKRSTEGQARAIFKEKVLSHFRRAMP